MVPVPKRRLMAVAITLSALIGCDLRAQSVYATSDVASARAAKAEAIPDDPASLNRQLEAIRTESVRAESEQDVPQGATLDEALERRHLLSELTLTLERHIAVLERLPEILQRKADQEAQAKTWRARGGAEPVSILEADHQREMLEDTRARVKAARMRLAFIGQRIADDERRLTAADVMVRQISEKAADGLPPDQKGRQAWLLDLAHQRARTVFAGLAEMRAAKKQEDAEIAALLALEDVQQKQLAGMKGAVVFPQSDLDVIVARLDREIGTLKKSEGRLQGNSSKSHAMLNQAQAELMAAKNTKGGLPPENRLRELERDVALWRIRVDTDDLAVDVLRRTIEVKGWERDGWRYRWLLVNGGDRSKVREGLVQLNGLIEHLEGVSRYLQVEITHLLQQGGGSESDPGALLAAELQAAYQQRAQSLRDAQSVADKLLGTFRIWAAGIQASEAHRSWLEIGRDGRAQATDALRTAWNFELFSADDSVVVDGRRVDVSRSITIGKTLGVILLVVAGALLSRHALNGLYFMAGRYFSMSKPHAATLARWSHILVVSVLFFVALYLANIPLTVFAFLGGALAIGVGFGAQVLLKNMISGIMLLVERPLRVGDIVEVGAVRGTVTQINVRSSTVLTGDGIEILVPNSTFIENNVTNWTYSNAHVRRSVSVGTSYAVPPARVEAVLMRVVDSHPEVLKTPAPSVLLDDFGTDAMHFTLRYWINYTQDADSPKIASDIRFGIAQALGEAGIEIPFAQRVVHIKRS